MNDRAAETIRRRGEHIDPREIEQAVESHPLVDRAAAVAVPDGIGDTAIGVFATAHPGVTVHPVDIGAQVAGLLAPFKRPRHVAVLPALPTTPTEKIDRVELRRRLATTLAGPGTEGGPPVRWPVTRSVVAPATRSDSWRQEIVQRVRGAVGQRRDELEDAAVQLLGVTRRVARADIALTGARLAAFGELCASLRGREPVGVVALGLPGNAILSNPVTATLSAVLSGNRVRVRLPERSRAWAELVAGLLGPITPEVEFVGTGGASFLADSFRCPDVGAVMAFGSDAWAGRYDELARMTATRFVFEGPGNDPFLVLDPSCVDDAAADAVEAAFYNAGQACTSPERFLVVRDAYEPFLRRVVELTGRLAVGDPAAPETQVGPLVDHRRADHVMRVIQDAVFRGAEVLAGGTGSTDIRVAGRPLPLLPPTVLADVPPDAAAMREETFGPLIAVHRVDSAAEAVRLAEGSRYGLAASVFGGEAGVPARLARSHGQVFVGETWLGHGRRRPLAPAGGRKQSGWVCEWRGEEFIRRDGPRVPALEFSRPSNAARPA
jgi:betaine-aldehyde dehydrogenase